MIFSSLYIYICNFIENINSGVNGSATTQQPIIPRVCLNNGVYDRSMQLCHCPSGFSRDSCEIFEREIIEI